MTVSLTRRAVYTIFTPAPAFFTPIIRPKRYSSISTTKEVYMDLICLTLAALLAAITLALAYAIARTTGSR
jgi:hypothetical protein